MPGDGAREAFISGDDDKLGLGFLDPGSGDAVRLPTGV